MKLIFPFCEQFPFVFEFLVDGVKDWQGFFYLYELRASFLIMVILYATDFSTNSGGNLLIVNNSVYRAQCGSDIHPRTKYTELNPFNKTSALFRY